MYGTAKNTSTSSLFKAVCLILMSVSVLMLGLSAPADAKYRPPYASIVVDANTGKVLQATSADRYRYPASITKVMTLYLLFEALEQGKVSLNTPMRVSSFAASQQPSKLGLPAGSTIRVKDAMAALAVKSANDIAVVIAEHLGGSEANFARMMTQRARQLGMNKTTFKNASGLPNSRQKTTARNLAVLGYSMMTRFPRYAQVFKKTHFRYRGKTYRSYNYLLGRVKGVDGIKTGYTRASGFNLLSSRSLGSKNIIAVVLGGRSSKTRNRAMVALVEKYIHKASSRERKLRHFAGLRLDQRIYTNAAPTQFAQIQNKYLNKPITLPKDNAPKPRVNVAHAAAALANSQAQALSQPITITSTPKPPTLILASAAPNLPPKDLAETQLEQGDSNGDPVITGWSVQIGAVPAESAANAILKKHKNKGGHALIKSTPYTQPVEIAGNTLWRARYGNMSKAEAKSACSTLKRNGVSCYVIQ